MPEDPEARRAAALVAAAIRAHDEDEGEDRARFFASAARGRPEVSDEFGRTVELREAGRSYPFRVFRTGISGYRVDVGGRRIETTAPRDDDGSLRLTVPAGSHVVAWPADGMAVEVDGSRFAVERDDRGMVRAPAPSVVVAVPVKAGQAVEAGQTVAVLEAMKMEMSVAAPHTGTIRKLLVGTNQQVNTGDALLQLSPEDIDELDDPVIGEPARFELLLEGDVAEAVRQGQCRRTLEELRRLALGFDVDPAPTKLLGAGWTDACGDDTEPIRRGEEEFLETLADVCSLTSRILPQDDESGESMLAHEEELLTYLRYVDAAHPSLSPAFVENLRRAVGHYGVASLDRSPELEEALYRLYRSHRRVPEQVPAAQAILDRRLDRMGDLRPVTERGFRDLLDRTVVATQGRYLALADLAREVRYRYFDQPLLEEARGQAYTQVEADLAQLEQDPDTPDREARIRSLVDCPQPLKGLLTRRIASSARNEVRTALTEALARRYYRIRDLHDVRSTLVDGMPLVRATYPHEGSTVHLIATHAKAPAVVDAAAVVARLVPVVPDEEDVVIDLYLWRDGPPGDPDVTSKELARVLDEAPFGRPVRRVVVALSGADSSLKATAMEHFTFRPSADGYREEMLYRGLHPMMGKRLEMWRLSNFWLDRLPSLEDVYLFRAVARGNPKDERLFALAEVRDMTPVRDGEGRVVSLPHMELMLTEALEAIRLHQSHRPPGKRLQWNRVLLSVWPPIHLPVPELFGIVHRLAPLAEGLGLEKVVVRARLAEETTGELHDRVIHISNPVGRGLSLRFDEPADRPIRPLPEYMQKVVQTRQRGLVYPYEIVKMLTPGRGTSADFPPGEFQELDLDEEGSLGPVDRPFGQNTANVVVGIISTATAAHPEGMRRVAVLGDPSHALGSLSEPECTRIVAALDLAERMSVPLEWFAVSAGAKISMSSGTENMDWIGRVLRRLIEFTQAGGEVNVVVCGINVGAQPYWNAEATMLMHTKGILIMTPGGAMVLTGKQALDYSGGVSAEDNVGIGGYDRVMGPNGQAQYWAADLHEACRILLRHYEHTYVHPGERFPRRVPTTDPSDRDVRRSPHRPEGESAFLTVGDVLSEEANPGRKKPFDIRSVMRACADRDHPPLERWGGMRDAEIAVVWDAHLGGQPVCMIGIESRPLPRHEQAPADGPEHWTSGTLFPVSSKKIARAINATSGNRPLVVLANLSGFDGSPESLRKLQLEYGAEIGRAVVNFRGPMVFCVISRYHGGAFVVFSRTLNESMEIAAVEGSFASVIGGAPAAAVVFAREVDVRTNADGRLQELEEALAVAGPADKGRLRAGLEEVRAAVRSEKLGQVASEFDDIHTIYRAREVGSVDRIIAPSELRPYLIDAVERGIKRELERIDR